MPAIDPARLRHQAVMLAEYFGEPAAFVRSLHHLLDTYAERAYRAGQAGEPAPLIPAYRVKPPVLRQIIQELAPLAEEQPELALALVDALWQVSNLEYRLLAAWLLGQTPPFPVENILTRVNACLAEKPDQRLADALLNQGLARIRSEQPAALLAQIETWLSRPELDWQQLALQTLTPLIATSRFDNLPVFFRLIQPLARSLPARLRPDVLDVVAALARRSPKETAFFLHQNLLFEDSHYAPWLVRQSLKEFPEELQEGLRMAVREKGRA